jgi:hypothetical protein
VCVVWGAGRVRANSYGMLDTYLPHVVYRSVRSTPPGRSLHMIQCHIKRILHPSVKAMDPAINGGKVSRNGQPIRRRHSLNDKKKRNPNKGHVRCLQVTWPRQRHLGGKGGEPRSLEILEFSSVFAFRLYFALEGAQLMSKGHAALERDPRPDSLEGLQSLYKGNLLQTERSLSKGHLGWLRVHVGPAADPRPGAPQPGTRPLAERCPPGGSPRPNPTPACLQICTISFITAHHRARQPENRNC